MLCVLTRFFSLLYKASSTLSCRQKHKTRYNNQSINQLINQSIDRSTNQRSWCQPSLQTKTRKHNQQTNHDTDDYDAICYAFFPFFPFLMTPPRMTQRRALRAAANSGVILHVCFFSDLTSSSLRFSQLAISGGKDFKPLHLARVVHRTVMRRLTKKETAQTKAAVGGVIYLSHSHYY